MTTPQTLTSPQALATRQQLQRDAAEMGSAWTWACLAYAAWRRSKGR